MGFFNDSRKQTVNSFSIPFEKDDLVHVMVMNVFGSSGKQAVSGVDEKASHMVDAMAHRLMSLRFTIIDIDVYPDPSVKGATGAPCYKAIFKVK